MNIINYISIVAVPAVILLILLYGFFERKNVFDIFLKGANDGFKMVIKIFPTLVGLFLAIGALSSSGILDFLIEYQGKQHYEPSAKFGGKRGFYQQ